MKKYFLFLIVLSFAMVACKKKKAELPPEPEITFVSVTPLSVTQFVDSIEVRFTYKDNQGDVGDLSPDEYSLEVKDSRLAKPDYYHIKPLTPDEKKLMIEGEFNVKINTLFLLGTGTTETTILSIKLKDREGNWSNDIKTPSITIHQ